MKFYYEVLVVSTRYHGHTYLTYYSSSKIPIASIVKVMLKIQPALAVITKEVNKPAFTTKELVRLDTPPLPVQTIKLIEWMENYYSASIGSIMQLFLPSNLLKFYLLAEPPEDKPGPNTIALPPLNAEQLSVIRSINKPGSYLIHGDTGTGKTRVYMELAKQSIALGKSVIILTPEISLTSQLYKNFQSLFGDQVLVVHSQLKQKERIVTWLKILKSTRPLIVIGTRSALFSPLKKVGLIVIDESHEQAYKQESSPYYHAIRVAGKLIELHKGILVLGSATPSVTDYYIADQKKVSILRMQTLATTNDLKKMIINIIDIKDRSNFIRSPYLSDQLIKAIEKSLKRKEQALLFLNRRGTARIILCSKCGWQALCPVCDTPLTYHGDSHSLHCHTCSHKEPAVSNCPVCQNTDITFKSIGTKAVVEQLEKLFPEARLGRFDTDNKKAERFENHYHSIRRGDIDILVGTQTLAKGLDLPKLSLVGIITADTSLTIPDYTAQERLYQLISQVIGRVGRGHRQGLAIVQTYLPTSPVLQAALAKDWLNFYQNELVERQTFIYPPFCYLLKLVCKRVSRQSAQKTADKLAEELKNKGYRVIVNGPAPAFHERQGNKFTWQLIIKSKRRDNLLKIISMLPNGWLYDLDPINLL